MRSSRSVRRLTPASITTSTSSTTSATRTWCELEKLMEEIVDADLPFKEQEITREQAIEYFQKRNEPYKVELAAGDPRGRAHHAALARRVRRPLPRRSRAVDRQAEGVQAALASNAYWKGDAQQPADAAHLRHRLLRREGAEGVPHADRGSEEARPPQARHASSACSRSISGRRARRSGCRKGTTLYNTLAELHARACSSRAGYVEVKTPLIYQQGAVGDVGPLGALPREHVPHRVRRRDDGHEADELPGRTSSSSRASCTATATCRCAITSRRRCTATRRRACSRA